MPPAKLTLKCSAELNRTVSQAEMDEAIARGALASLNLTFSACLIFFCHLAGCDSVVIFDKIASKTLGMRLLD